MKLCVSIENQVDEILTKYFLIVGKTQMQNIQKYLKPSQKDSPLSLETQNYIKHVAWHVFNIISSTKSSIPECYEKRKKEKKGDEKTEKKYHDELVKAFDITGIALEYFVLYLLNKDNLDKDIKFEKGPKEIDALGIDFFSHFHSINFGIQITYREDQEGIEKKEIDTHNIAVMIDDPKKNKPIADKKPTEFHKSMTLESENFFQRHIPNIPVLFTINSETSKKLYASRYNKEGNIFKNAYVKWEKNGFPNTGPEIYLDHDIQKELGLISKSYTIALGECIAVAKSITDFSKVIKYTKHIPEGIFFVSYRPSNQEIEISFHKKEEEKEEFIYNMTFYVTRSFLDELGIKKKLSPRIFKKPKKIEKIKSLLPFFGENKKNHGGKGFINIKRHRKGR